MCLPMSAVRLIPLQYQCYLIAFGASRTLLSAYKRLSKALLRTKGCHFVVVSFISLGKDRAMRVEREGV